MKQTNKIYLSQIKKNSNPIRSRSSSLKTTEAPKWKVGVPAETDPFRSTSVRTRTSFRWLRTDPSWPDVGFSSSSTRLWARSGLGPTSGTLGWSLTGWRRPESASSFLSDESRSTFSRFGTPNTICRVYSWRSSRNMEISFRKLINDDLHKKVLIFQNHLF